LHAACGFPIAANILRFSSPLHNEVDIDWLCGFHAGWLLCIWLGLRWVWSRYSVLSSCIPIFHVSI